MQVECIKCSGLKMQTQESYCLCSNLGILGSI